MYIYKYHFNKTAFIKARVAQSVEHQARNLKDVGWSLTVGKNFHFVFCRFRRASGRSTGPIQKITLTFIRGNRCIDRIII